MLLYEDVSHLSPWKEWPGKTIKKFAHSQAPQSDETIKFLLQVPHIHVDILASMGLVHTENIGYPR